MLRPGRVLLGGDGALVQEPPGLGHAGCIPLPVRAGKVRVEEEGQKEGDGLYMHTALATCTRTMLLPYLNQGKHQA